MLIVIVGFGGYWAGRLAPHRMDQTQQAGESARKQIYHCPMHPNYTADKPGDCPICGMKLVLMDSDDMQMSGDGHRGQKDRKIKFYRNPMHPSVTSPVPAKDNMGMDYVPVYEEEESLVSVEGQAAIKVNSERQQLIGVKTEAVQVRPLTKTIRASARVAYDPELYNDISEYREALQSKNNMKDSTSEDAKERTNALVRAATLKLRQAGLSESQINKIDKDYQSNNLLLPEKGGSVWIYAQVYESEAGLVLPGQRMDVTSTALPGEKFWGTVTSVDPIVNPETRTLKVRAEVNNTNGKLKLEMFVNAKIQVELGSKLSVPREAILNGGERQIVFVDQGNGSYEPREVRLGSETESYVEILSGVSKGEKVVSSGNFLIDSESKLKAAAQGMGSKK